MTPSTGDTEKVKNLFLLMKTNEGIYQVRLSEDVKKTIFKLVDKRKIVLEGNDLSKYFKL